MSTTNLNDVHTFLLVKPNIPSTSNVKKNLISAPSPGIIQETRSKDVYTYMYKLISEKKNVPVSFQPASLGKL